MSETELKDQRVVTLMTTSEVKTIDEWMFSNRLKSRGEAIRRLCQIGLETGRTKTADEHVRTILKIVEG